MIYKTEKPRRTSAKIIFPTVFACMIFVLLIISPKTSIEYMKTSLALCVKSLVPSLFPFMIISDFLISGYGLTLLRSVLAIPISKIFGLSRDGASAALLGLLCGFPIGAKSALRLYSEKRISHAELSHIMSFCNIPSSAFVCGTVSVMLGSTRIGIILYASLLLSSLIIGLAGRAIYKYDRLPPAPSRTSSDPVTAFTSSVTSSVHVMLNVCAYVVFFSVISGYTSDLCTSLKLPRITSAIISGMLEISGGISSLSPLLNPKTTLLVPSLAAFFLGFSGISVCFQIWSVDKSSCISRKKFFLQKLLHGAVSSVICFALVRAFPLSTSLFANTMSKITFKSYGLYICILFFLSASLPLIATLLQKPRHPRRNLPKSPVYSKKSHVDPPPPKSKIPQ